MEPRGIMYNNSMAGSQAANACPPRTTIQDLLSQVAQQAQTVSVLNDRISQAMSPVNSTSRLDSPTKAPSPMDVESRLIEIGRLISDAISSAEQTLKSLGA